MEMIHRFVCSVCHKVVEKKSRKNFPTIDGSALLPSLAGKQITLVPESERPYPKGWIKQAIITEEIDGLTHTSLQYNICPQCAKAHKVKEVTQEQAEAFIDLLSKL